LRRWGACEQRRTAALASFLLLCTDINTAQGASARRRLRTPSKLLEGDAFWRFAW